MSTLQRHPRLRWLVPSVALALVFGIPAVSQRVASADPGLPPRTAEQLLTDLAKAKPVAMSGTVTQTMNLGLPTLPQFGPGGDDLSPMSLLTGNHTWRIWTNASDSVKVAKVNGSAELSVIHNPTETWLWNSQSREAIQKKHEAVGADKKPATMPTTPAPGEIAKAILAELDPTTDVSTDEATTVAGRPAYQLVLTPTTPGTRIGQVKLAIDAQNSTPLRLIVTPRGTTTAAVQVAFTAVDFTAPPAKVFTFTPPAGATVKDADQVAAEKRATVPETTPTTKPAGKPTGMDSQVVGTSWTQVRVLTGLGDLTAAENQDPMIAELLGQFPTVKGQWGEGKLVSTALFSAVVTTDGRVAVGMVEPALLYAALR
ncbi:hypothetical protein IPV09_11960 [Tessaracoccus sp. SD287]|uniref:LolA family protein n=1 Tax=Tessaracoccus sp. SD287 TaxID=2782008 RepID=UPI001A96F6EC|nr:hypothetical protein [Tessaracoccus sp. SD287]MBO1032052.1 hypothetical protein [Tessaracoccus sp. SD287]